MNKNNITKTKYKQLAKSEKDSMQDNFHSHSLAVNIIIILLLISFNNHIIRFNYSFFFFWAIVKLNKLNNSTYII